MAIYNYRRNCKKFSISRTKFNGVTILVDIQYPFEFDIDTSTLKYILENIQLAIKRQDLIIVLELDAGLSNKIQTSKNVISELRNYDNYLICAKNKTSGIENLNNILPYVQYNYLTFFGGYISQCLIRTIEDTIKFLQPRNPISIPIDACFEEYHKNKYESVALLESLIPSVSLI